MRRFLIATLALAVPTVALAAAVQPSMLLLSQDLRGKPMDMSHELHVTYQNVRGSVTLRGSAEGETLETAKADLRVAVTLDSAEGDLRATGQVRIVDGVAYMRVDSLGGALAEDVIYMAGRVPKGQWMAFPLQQQDMAIWMPEPKAETMAAEFIDAFLSADRITTPGERGYSVRLRADAMDRLADLLTALGNEHPEALSLYPGDVLDIQRMLQSTNLHIKFFTDGQAHLQGIKYYLASNQREGAFVIQGNVSIRKTPVAVYAPVRSVRLDDPSEEWESDDAAKEPAVPVREEPRFEPKPDPAALDCSAMTDTERVFAQRKGLCGQSRPSRRSLGG